MPRRHSTISLRCCVRRMPSGAANLRARAPAASALARPSRLRLAARRGDRRRRGRGVLRGFELRLNAPELLEGPLQVLRQGMELGLRECAPTGNQAEVQRSQRKCDPRARRWSSICPRRVRRSCETLLNSSVKESSPRHRAHTTRSQSSRNRDHQMICALRRNDKALSEVDWQPRSLVSPRAAHSSVLLRDRTEDEPFSQKQSVRNSEKDPPKPLER